MKKKNEKATKNKKVKNFPIIFPNAAGIDIGSKEHWVCVPGDRVEDNVRKFGTFTCDLNSISDWLEECRVEVVAMESTGVYWIPLFQILESRGFEVYLVNSRDSRGVPGKPKNDPHDSRWLQKLMTCGLLGASFIPEEKIRELRTYIRQRESLVQQKSRYIQRMQKSLQQMNLLLHNVISDITGVTGMAIIQSILRGERDPNELSKLRGSRIQSSEEEIAKALEGDYRDEHIFTLRQSLKSYEFIEEQIKECKEEIEKVLKSYNREVIEEETKQGDSESDKILRESDEEELQKKLLQEMVGVDLCAIPGLGIISVQIALSETGTDMDKWKTEKYFTSWLSLSPNKKISGGKEIGNSKTRKNKNRAATVFRLAAASLEHSASYLGAYYRRIKARIGPPKAITATARKIAVIFYSMIKFKKEFIEKGENYFIETNKAKMMKKITKQAKLLGYELVLANN
jgi:transposase